MSKLLVTETKERMEKAIESTKHRFSTIRAGRANVAMLADIKVSQYGSEMPLNQVGNVSAPEARLLVIDPWDKTVIPAIEKAINLANLGLTPNNDGKKASPTHSHSGVLFRDQSIHVCKIVFPLTKGCFA